MLRKSSRKIGGGEEKLEDDSETEVGQHLWEKLNLAIVGPNATQWFEEIGTTPVSEIIEAQEKNYNEIRDWSPFVSGQIEEHVISHAVQEVEELGQSIEIQDSKLGRAIVHALGEVGIDMSLLPPISEDDFRRYEADKELIGLWATDSGIPFHQHLKIFKDSSGTERAFWFVRLLASTNKMSEQDTHVNEDGVFGLPENIATYGEVSKYIHLPVLAKNLAWFCESPFKSTPIVQMSRDIAFSGDQEHGVDGLAAGSRPRPLLAYSHDELIWSYSPNSRPDEPLFIPQSFPDIALFGWTFDESAIDHLESTILPLLVNGSQLAVSTVEDGFRNFQRDDFPADFDSVLANPCTLHHAFSRGKSRMGGAVWVPVTELGHKLEHTRQSYSNWEEHYSQSSAEIALPVLEEIMMDGIGLFQNSAINTAAYRYFLPAVASGNRADVLEAIRLLELAISSGETYEAYNARNNLALLLILAGAERGEERLLEEVINSNWTEHHAEALAYMAYSLQVRGRSQEAAPYLERSIALGGFTMPDWVPGVNLHSLGKSEDNESSQLKAPFCSTCGYKFSSSEHNFCANCGGPRVENGDS